MHDDGMEAVYKWVLDQIPGILFGAVVAFMIPWLLHKAQFRNLRERITCLQKKQEGEITRLQEKQEKGARRSELLEQRLNDTRTQFIATNVATNIAAKVASGGSFSGDAIVNKRRSTLEEDFKTAPGSGKVAARLILQEDEPSEAERILNIFESQKGRIDEAYPYVAFATKLAEQDEMTQASDALSRLPESAQWQVSEAIEWALSELSGKSENAGAIIPH